MKIVNIIKDFLFPNKIRCIFCGNELFLDTEFCICEKCLKTLPYLTNNICEICGRKVVGEGKICNSCTNQKLLINFARAPLLYTKTMHKVIYGLKYKNAKYLAEPLSKLLYNFYKSTEEFNDIDIIIPVPLHKNKFKKRGYNQSELLLTSFLSTNKVKTDIVEKIKDTVSQTKKSYLERLTSLDGSFEVKNKQAIKNKNILIVDDIFTTGATCNAIAKELFKANAKSVKCLTLCNVAYDYKNL
ncbi:MAG: ComF family protein [Clostridiales bacterium]|nr:ComF family protein [Clostridiales bacterium]